jgi:hypothetical protein
MESKRMFPDDVLSVISAFSRPQMQFVNEWAQIHRDIQKNKMVFEKGFHADIKAKLFTPEASQYMEVFIPYMAAAVATRRFTLVRDRFPLGRGTMTPDDYKDYEFWRQMTSEAMDERHRLWDQLQEMLYGPEEPWTSDEE